MGALGLLDAVARELMLFAGVGLLFGGLDELAVDACFWAGRLSRRPARLTLATLPAAAALRFAVFVPAWDEAGVIAPMLRTLLTRWGDADYRVYVGVYPNDAATRAAVQPLLGERVRMVIAPRPGPTTKADNLNSLWRALMADDRAADAVVLHDAEDVVDAAELRTFAALLPGRDAVQLPVLPIVGRGVSWVSAVYGDEFAESHIRTMVVRAAIGAGMPLAGTGCCLRTERLRAIADARGGLPFDADSLVEDYELGLKLTAAGAHGCFARVREDSGALVAVRAIFPRGFGAAVRQKARWMAGIALAGWDRTGWSRAGGIADHWMRARDRRAPMAMLVLATAYVAMAFWATAAATHWAGGSAAPPIGRITIWILWINAGLLGWRMLMRMVFTARAYGWREAVPSIGRFFVGNAIALCAAPVAVGLYLKLLRGEPPVWHKTAHDFPDVAAE